MKPDDKIIDKIKKIMSENESLYKVSPSLFDPLFEAGEIVTFPRGYMIMKAGRQLRDVYVIIDGLVGSFYESGSKVILHGLATPGTLLIHGASFFNVKPSFMHWEAVVATTVLRVPDSFIREYLHSCHEFAIWMYGMAENVIMYYWCPVNVFTWLFSVILCIDKPPVSVFVSAVRGKCSPFAWFA